MKLVHQFLIVSLFVMFLSGCYHQSATINPVQKNDKRISRKSTVLITQANDGVYGSKKYTGSGATVTNFIYASIGGLVDRCEIHDEYVTKTEALKLAEKYHADYIVYPRITHWEDRNTPWSGIADRAAVRVEVLDVALHGKVIKSGLIEANSSWYVFVNDPPDVIIKDPLQEYVTLIF